MLLEVRTSVEALDFGAWLRTYVGAVLEQQSVSEAPPAPEQEVRPA